MGRNRISVIGVGNRHRGDDGAGPAVLDELEQRNLPENVALIDLGSNPLHVIEYFASSDRVVVIDAALMGVEAGEVKRFKVEDLSLLGKNPFSTHSYGLSEGIYLAKSLGCMPNELVLIGIQPGCVDAGTELSPDVRKSISMVAQNVLEDVFRWDNE